MTEHPDRTHDDEEIPVQIDSYGVKANLPATEQEQRPQSWKEVARRVNRHLMLLVEGVFRLPAAAIDTPARVLRSIGALFEKRVAGAHKKADADESRLQVEATHRQLPVPRQIVTESREEFEALLEETLAKGVPVAIEELENGKVAIYLVPQEAQGVARKAIKGELPAPKAAK